MFKKHELVVELKKKPKYNRGEEITNVENRDKETAKTRLDNLDRALLIRRVADETMKVMGFYFAARTLSGVITHVVVTKVGPPVIIEAVKEN